MNLNPSPCCPPIPVIHRKDYPSKICQKIKLWITWEQCRRVGLDDPQRSLPTPSILWFCECKKSLWDQCGKGRDVQGRYSNFMVMRLISHPLSSSAWMEFYPLSLSPCCVNIQKPQRSEGQYRNEKKSNISKTSFKFSWRSQRLIEIQSQQNQYETLKSTLQKNKCRTSYRAIRLPLLII